MTSRSSGPIFVLKVRFTPAELAHRLVAELWLYPDGSHILELSTKCAPQDIFEIASNVRHFLIERGVERHGEQETKTKHALQFFAKDLKAAKARTAKAG